MNEYMMLEVFMWATLILLGWGWTGVASGIIWTVAMEEDRVVTIGDFISSLVLGPLLSYSLLVVWCGLKTNVGNAGILIKIVYVLFYTPVSLVSILEIFLLKILEAILPPRITNKRVL